MLEKVRTALILISSFTAVCLAVQVYKDQAKIQGLERRIAAEQAHSATCNWGCPSTLRDHDAEHQRQITALRSQVVAMRHDSDEECAPAVAEAVRTSLRMRTEPTQPRTDRETDAQVFAASRTLQASCAFWWARRRFSPNDPRFADWAMDCEFSGYPNPW